MAWSIGLIPHGRIKAAGLAVVLAVGLSMLTGAGSSQAADTTPMAEDPGPVGSFAWKGFNWQKRFWGGAPMYNARWDANNVSNQDANVYVKLSVTNPTGSAPKGA